MFRWHFGDPLSRPYYAAISGSLGFRSGQLQLSVDERCRARLHAVQGLETGTDALIQRLALLDAMESHRPPYSLMVPACGHRNDR